MPKEIKVTVGILLKLSLIVTLVFLVIGRAMAGIALSSQLEHKWLIQTPQVRYIHLKNPKIMLFNHINSLSLPDKNGHYCGTAANGWLNGAHPTTLRENVIRTVCIAWDGNSCLWNTDVEIRMCSEFYVYKLKNVPVCNSKYCAK